MNRALIGDEVSGNESRTTSPIIRISYSTTSIYLSRPMTASGRSRHKSTDY